MIRCDPFNEYSSLVIYANIYRNVQEKQTGEKNKPDKIKRLWNVGVYYQEEEVPEGFFFYYFFSLTAFHVQGE